MVDPDLDRRMTNLERRLDWMDEHGTRAVGALQLQVSELIKDSGKIEGALSQLGNKVDKVTSARTTNMLTFIGIMIPLYGLVIGILLQVR